MQKVIIMNYICLWGILASITGIAIMFSVIKHKKSVSAIKNGTYLIFSILMICLGITNQLMQLFFNNTHHQLSKQEICDALWPKKPDASETLYTLIRRIKPVIEQNSNLMIESERGKSYRLIIR